MMKKLTALTLAMLMLLNPMTAFAVPWYQVMNELIDPTSGQYDDGTTRADVVDGAVTIYSGEVEDVILDSRFSSYTFKGGVEIGGETFLIYVQDGQSVAVNIEAGKDIALDETDYSAANDGQMYVLAGDGSSITLNNDRNVLGSLSAIANSGSMITVNNDGNVLGSLEAIAHSDSMITVNNDGNVGETVLTGALGGGQVSVIVTGTAGAAVVGGIEGKDATLGVLGGLKNDNPYLVDAENVGKVTLLIAAGNGDVIDPSVVEEIYKKSVLISGGEDYSGQPDALEIITTDANGEKTARYSIVNGKATLVEVYEKESAGVTYDDPAFWTAERIRHDKEEERKAAAIGGVTGSPYWIKQLYLGYMSLDLRLFDGEEQLLFKEYLSWQPDGSKLLTLRTKITDTSDLMMRLDGMVIKKLNQAGISTIAIVDGNGNPFMAYEVADLEGARAMYELGFEDYIVVGEATDDVMMIGADGQIVPIEGEKAEETPAA